MKFTTLLEDYPHEERSNVPIEIQYLPKINPLSHPYIRLHKICNIHARISQSKL